jgi:hypothetical protein
MTTMTTRLFLYSLWCLGISGVFVVTGMYAYSPFAEGGRAARGAGFYGPTHK